MDGGKSATRGDEQLTFATARAFRLIRVRGPRYDVFQARDRKPVRMATAFAG